MSTLYREWCKTPMRRKGVMLPQPQIDLICCGADSGYASVYAFDEDAANEIIDSRSSSGFSRFAVYADQLTLDLDDGPEQLRVVEKILSERGLEYSVFDSGSKGYHVCIPHPRTLHGRSLPYSQRVWVEGLGVEADLSLYQHGRILSLPGRVHPKTGRKKTLVKEVAGASLDLPMVDPPGGPVFTFGEGGMGDLEAGVWRLLQSLTDEPSPGNRHTRLWSTAKHFADAGLSYEWTCEILQRINEQWQNGKDPSEVEIAASQAYQRSLSPPSTNGLK